jgi:hypothetical protein
MTGRLAPAAVFLLITLGACTSHSAAGAPAPTPTPTVTTPTESQGPRLPPIGGAGYPVALYPATVPGRPGAVARCPAPTHLRPAANVHPDVAVRLARRFHTQSLDVDLHHADRAYWPSLLAAWRYDSRPNQPYEGPVLLAGRLPQLHGLGVPSALKGWVRTSCGAAVARASFIVVTGPRNGRALQGAWVMVNRLGKPLLYFVYP